MYTQDDIKKLLLKKLVVFGYFEKAADYGDNDDVATQNYLWGQIELLVALCGDPEFRKTPEAVQAYKEGIEKFNKRETLSYSDAYKTQF